MLPHTKKPVSLFVIITLIISLCMITPCMIAGIYFYATLRNSTFDTIERNIDSSAESSFSSLDSTLLSVKNAYYSIISDPVINPELYNYIFPGNETTFNESVDERLTKMMFYTTIWNENILTSITLTNDFNTYHYIGNPKYGVYPGKEDSSALNMITDNREALSKSLGTERIHTLMHSRDDSGSLFYIRDYYGYPDGAFKGLLSFQLSEESLMSNFTDFDKYTDTLCFAFDESGIVIMSSKEELQGETISALSVQGVSLKHMMEDPDNYLAKTKTLTNYPLTACVLIPLEPIYQELHSQLRGYLVIFICLLLLVIVFALAVSRYVSRYIHLLIKRMTRLSQSDYSQTLPVYGITELDNLSTAFTTMSSQIKRLLNEKYANEVLLKESELKALQAQINPHFLFNTLLSVSWKARANQDMECYEMITALSSLLNANIYTPATKFITLQEELQNVRYYLQIQKVRFGPKLSYDIDVDTKLMDHSILKLCLQPLVENAVVHGLENKVEEGTILITGDIVDEQKMLLQIIDNGIGFHPEEMNRQLNEPDASVLSQSEGKGQGHHIGLINTHLRLKYTYGEQYGITIASTPGEGTTISVRLPLS